jgi:MFS transporter, PAT family, beta-lactamase induction signal transducer AmpG
MSTQRVPAVWVLSVQAMTVGMVGGFIIVTLPQLLAPQGLTGSRIAVAIAIIVSPMFWNFVFAPCLDVRLRRRTYAPY